MLHCVAWSFIRHVSEASQLQRSVATFGSGYKRSMRTNRRPNLLGPEYYPLARHENSRYWVDFPDFSFFRLQPIYLYYVGGFGVMGWVEARDYEHAAPDLFAEVAPGILAHMNADHVEAMILLAGLHAGVEATEATMTAVDRLGFSLRLKTT